nr:3D domain-containing protein [Paenibacillus sinensis]
MNEMGKWQRSWCIAVTIVFMSALLILYMKPENGKVEAPVPGSPAEAGVVSHISPLPIQQAPAVKRAVEVPVRVTGNVRLVRATVFEHQAEEKVVAYGTAPLRAVSVAVRSTTLSTWTGGGAGGASRPTSATAGTGNSKPTSATSSSTVSTSTASSSTSSSSAKPAAKQISIPVAAPGPEQIIRTMKVTATGYTAGYESTGKRPSHPQYGITYSGVKVRRDKNAVSTIAADPKVLPMGSILYVPGYGYAVVADTGSAIKGHKIDLYFKTTRQVYNEWGKKSVEVQLIKRGKGKCTEAMLNSISRAIQAYDTVPQEMLEEII